MSVSDLDVKKVYGGDGATVTFAINFAFTDDTEVRVVLRDEVTSTITETLQVAPTNYSISSTNVVMVTAPASTEKLLIIRANPLTQLLDLIGSGSLNPQQIEDALDKLTKVAQELDERTDRCAKLKETFPNEGTGSINDLELPTPSASKILAWDSGATALENVTATSADSISLLADKGDLISYSTVAAKLAVGANSSFLAADSNAATGLAYKSMDVAHHSILILAGGPSEDIENDMRVLKFDDGLTQQLSVTLTVPSWYSAGTQISLSVKTYTPTTSLTTLVSGTTTLFVPGTDAASSTTNQHTSTNSAITAATTANKITEQVVDISDSSGEINSVAVAAGHILKVVLSRDTGTDTDTATMRMLRDLNEVRIG